MTNFEKHPANGCFFCLYYTLLLYCEKAHFKEINKMGNYIARGTIKSIFIGLILLLGFGLIRKPRIFRVEVLSTSH